MALFGLLREPHPQGARLVALDRFVSAAGETLVRGTVFTSPPQEVTRRVEIGESAEAPEGLPIDVILALARMGLRTVAAYRAFDPTRLPKALGAALEAWQSGKTAAAAKSDTSKAGPFSDALATALAAAGFEDLARLAGATRQTVDRLITGMPEDDAATVLTWWTKEQGGRETKGKASKTPKAPKAEAAA